MSRIERSVSGSRAWVAAEVERWAEKERSRKDPRHKRPAFFQGAGKLSVV